MRGHLDSSFASFFTLNFDKTRRLLGVLLKSADLGEEAAQEAYYRAYARWSHVSIMSRPDSWVLVVGLHYGRRLASRHRRDRVIPDAYVDRYTSVADSLQMVSLLQRLSPRQQEAIALRYILDMSIDEVARSMSCSPGTVKATIHVALKNLQIYLSEEANVSEL
jgi:RNA polymerase sigma-70 factor, ECF subfamily